MKRAYRWLAWTPTTLLVLALCSCEGDRDLDMGPPSSARLTIATRSLFAPVGMSTGGYAQTPGQHAPKGPFAGHFQATTTLYHQPRAQVFRIESGGKDVIIAQTDLVGIHQDFWRLVTDIVQKRTGEDVRDRLILLANHSHSGPGHIFDAFFAPTVMDKFEPDIAERIATDIAICIAESLSTGDSVRVKIGWAKLQNKQMHADRRCENPDLQDDTMMVLGFADEEERLVALIVNYAMHGTVFSPTDAILSGDAAGAVEAALQQSTGAAVMFTQSWAGDMAPGHPKHHYEGNGRPTSSLPAVDRLESLGSEAVVTLQQIESKMQWLSTPTLRARSAEIAINRTELGYKAEEFPHPNGAILCGFGAPACGEAKADMTTCIPVPAGGGPTQVRLSAVSIGPVALATLPGEPLTSVGQHVVKRILAEAPQTEAVFVLGYAQDYTGYLLMPGDWSAGGYEAGFNYWGPNQGRYFADASASLAVATSEGRPTPWPVAPPRAYKRKMGPRYQQIEALEVGKVVLAPKNPMEPGQELIVEHFGEDPVVGAPLVTVHRPGESAPFPGVAPSQVVRQLEVSPPFSSEPVAYGAASAPRHFRWRTIVRTQPANVSVGVDLVGAFELRVEGVSKPIPFEVTSN